jgi:MFS family permease
MDFSTGFGMTLGFPTVLIPALQQKPEEESNDGFSLSKAQISWISSINLICVPFGCVVSGSITAYLGRKKAMQLVCVPLLASWIILYFASDVFHLYIALCVSGFTGKS